MPYKLNDISLSAYGIIPGRMAGEGIAVKGIFDMPKRIGDTYYEWAETNGVQPFVAADEIFMGGRTLYFQGILIGDVAALKSYLNAFKTAVDGFNDTVPFETPYGTFCVLVNKVTPKFYNGGALVLIEFFEPEVGASCSIGTTPTVYESELYSETAEKNNCADGYYGSTVQLIAPAGKFTSTVSQAAANLLAVQWVRDYKQDYANAQGTCTIKPTVYYNVKLTGTLQKNDCGGELIGSEVTYEIPAFKYSSLIDQGDADSQAQAELDSILTQAYANENGTCLVEFWNERVEYSLQKNDCGAGYTGETLTYYAHPGSFSSTVSQYDANAKALASLTEVVTQEFVNEQGSCINNTPSNVTYLGTDTLYPFFKTMRWRIGHVNPGSVFTFIAYGYPVTYTAESGDTPEDVVDAMVNLINAVSFGAWLSTNQMSLFSKPPQGIDGGNLLHLAYYDTKTFKLYVTN